MLQGVALVYLAVIVAFQMLCECGFFSLIENVELVLIVLKRGFSW